MKVDASDDGRDVSIEIHLAEFGDKAMEDRTMTKTCHATLALELRDAALEKAYRAVSVEGDD